MKIKNVLPYVRPSTQDIGKTERGRIERVPSSGPERMRGAEAEDRVELHTQRIVEEARSRLREIPETREERIQTLRQKIQSGNYQVSPEKVARAMLSDLLRDIY